MGPILRHPLMDIGLHTNRLRGFRELQLSSHINTMCGIELTVKDKCSHTPREEGRLESSVAILTTAWIFLWGLCYGNICTLPNNLEWISHFASPAVLVLSVYNPFAVSDSPPRFHYPVIP